MRILTSTFTIAACAALVVGSVGVPAAYAAPTTSTVTNSTTISPPDNTPVGVTSVLAVSGLPGHISDLNVTLNSISTTFPGDLDIELTGPNGKTVMLMSDSCAGNDFVNQSVTIDDEASSAFPSAAACPNASYWPTDGSATPDPLFVPVPTNGSLGAFDGADPNGNWTLSAADDVGGDVPTIAGGFSLTFVLTDEVKPVTTITKKPKSSTKRKAAVSFVSNEAGSTFECNLDGLGWNPCTSPRKLKNLSIGKHTFQVRATDPSKNVGVAAKVSWKVKAKR